MDSRSTNVFPNWHRKITPLSTSRSAKRQETFSKRQKDSRQSERNDMPAQGGTKRKSPLNRRFLKSEAQSLVSDKIADSNRDTFEVPSSEDEFQSPKIAFNRPSKRPKMLSLSNVRSSKNLSLQDSATGSQKTIELIRSQVKNKKHSAEVDSDFLEPSSAREGDVMFAIEEATEKPTGSLKPTKLSSIHLNTNSKVANKISKRASGTAQASPRSPSKTQVLPPQNSNHQVKTSLSAQSSSEKAQRNSKHGTCTLGQDLDPRPSSSYYLHDKTTNGKDPTSYSSFHAKKITRLEAPSNIVSLQPFEPLGARDSKYQDEMMRKDEELLSYVSSSLPLKRELHTTSDEQMLPKPLLNTAIGLDERKDVEAPRKRKLKDRLVENSYSNSRSLVTKSVSPSSSDEESEKEEDISANFSTATKCDTPRNSISNDDDSDYEKSSQAAAPQTSSLSSQTPGRVIVTYGQQRSHLVEKVKDGEKSLLESPIAELPAATPSQRRKLALAEASPSEETKYFGNRESESETEAQEQALRNVHELKAAGKMRRVALESDALLEDITTANTASLKRGALFRLTLKLFERTFREDFVRSGLHSKYFTIADAQLDQFGMAAFYIGASEMLSVVPTSSLLPQGPAGIMLSSFSYSLSYNNILITAAKAKLANMSKRHQADLRELSEKFIKRHFSGSFQSDRLTNRLVCLKCLDLCVSRLRQAGYQGKITEGSLFADLAIIATSNDTEDPEGQVLSLQMPMCLSALEALSAGTLFDGDDCNNLPEATLKNVYRVALASMEQNEENSTDASLMLRICLNITTNSRHNSKRLGQKPLIAAVTNVISTGFRGINSKLENIQRDQLIDQIVLSLGFLTNLVEEIDANRLGFLQTAADGSTCLQTILVIFKQRYMDAESATTETESKINVTFGYVAVLVCCLCLNIEIRHMVSNFFEDSSLSEIRRSMAQFIMLYRSIGIESDRQSADGNRHTQFMRKLENVLRNLTMECRISK